MSIQERRSGRSLKQLEIACNESEKFIYIIYPIASKSYYEALMDNNNLPVDKVLFRPSDFIKRSAHQGLRLKVFVDHYAFGFLNSSEIEDIIAHNHRVDNIRKM